MSDADNDVAADAGSVDRGVTLFLRRMLDDPLLGWTFDGMSQERLRRHALAFVIAALGGPDPYLGFDLRAAHERFELGNQHFDAAVEHLGTALRESGISTGAIAELAVRLDPLRRQIVSR